MSKLHILRGIVPNDTTIRIHLFDGSFETGFRIVGFEVAPSNWGVDPDCFGVLMTEDLGIDARDWNWGDNREKAWAAQNYNSAGAVGSYFSSFVPDVIVEDLYIATHTQTGQDTNYKVILEKVSMSEYEGALALVRNSSQG